ncbi:hypothetical protein CALCODRAFT_112216 [Calocera cornea HHB12733]|uniref:Nucleotidyltransferase family protein n=1 Tax=Calocera cornea HHB12733 TaxID=1353952 RepID=A0A165D1M2_9BASI|nr:hypothetical protein CALCODRAFT_112216 [Calocera cornea HHB12733]
MRFIMPLVCYEWLPRNSANEFSVIEFHFGHYIHHLEHLCSQAVPHFDIHFDIQGQISMARRQNLKALGIGLQTHPDLVAQIVEVGKLSLRDVERLSATCKTMRTSLPRETEHRLRSVLSKYFPDALIELAYTLRDHDALVSGSAMLHVLAPGHWEPGDLDIVLPESSCTTFEAFLTLHGYVFDASRQAALLRLYPQTAAPAAFRYRCFLKGERKIDLCYIEDSFPPLSHILTYHSTAVMNFYDGSELVCLFPDQTFAHQYVRNNLAMFNRRLQASLEKLKKRGFVQNVGWMHEWFATALDEQGEHVAPAKLPTIWRQPVAL